MSALSREAFATDSYPMTAQRWTEWRNFTSRPYRSSTHGGRWLLNFANPVAARVYGQFEKLREMPAGGIIAKPSFVRDASGQVRLGPLFVMEKMEKSWNPATLDWRYAMILPGGEPYGITKGVNARKVAFCNECHIEAGVNDALLFIPRQARAKMR